jgi:hypothetical protein
MLFPLSSFIHLKDICLRVFPFVGISQHSICGLGIMRNVCAVCKDVDVVSLCMLHWLVGFSTLLDYLCC